MIQEAKIILEEIVMALEDPNPDIEVIRATLKEADELPAQAKTDCLSMGLNDPSLCLCCDRQVE